MTLKEGLVAARSHIVFVLGLIVAFSIVIGLERLDTGHGGRTTVTLPTAADVPSPGRRAPTAHDRASAGIAWSYFAANTRPETGLVDSVAGFPATTLWDTGSYLMALIAAEELGQVQPDEVDRRASQALASLSRLPLVEGALPNKSYDTRTLEMLTYDGKPAPKGIGWSALDLARLLVPLAALERRHPGQAPAIVALLQGWDLDAAVRDGMLLGTSRAADGALQHHQEGRLGYEQYGARAMLLTGRDALTAAMATLHLTWVGVNGIEVPVDDRAARADSGPAFVLSEPYMLTGLELGWDTASHVLGWRVYEAQRQRFARTGVLTAVTEDHLDRPPRFVYSTVWGDGRTWAVLTPDGHEADDMRLLSTKAAFAWNALYDTDYTAKLVAAVADANDPDKGWYGGIYERDGSVNRVLSLNTNAVVLESLAYQADGPLLQPPREQPQ